jgi:hypothetical protein
MEPRACSASPVGTNFLIAGYARTTDGISLDPSLSITPVRASINTTMSRRIRATGSPFLLRWRKD